MSDTKQSCPACGFPLPPGAISCDNCGEAFGSAQQETKVRAAPDRDAPPPSAPVAAPLPDARPEAAMRCPSCGATVDLKFAYCPQCGTALKPGQGQKTRPATAASRQPAAPKGKKPQGGKSPSRKGGFNLQPWHMIVGFITLCIAIVALIMTSGSGGKKNEAGQQPQASAPINLEALKAAEEYVQAHSDDMDGVLRYANLLYDSQLFDRAITQYNAYLKNKPENVDARVDLGVCYYSLKQYDAAIAEMERAVKANPEHQLGNFNLGIVNLAKGNRDRANEWFAKAVAINGQNEIGKKSREMMGQAPSSGGM